MHFDIEEQIAKLHACTATGTIRPWSLIGIMFQVYVPKIWSKMSSKPNLVKLFHGLMCTLHWFNLKV